jgi:hypothetical protein
LKIDPSFESSDYPCLTQFKFKKRTCLFANKLEDRQSGEKAKTNEQEKSSLSSKPKQPLFRLNFSSCGKLCKNNQQIKAIIERLGGNSGVMFQPKQSP